MKYCLKQVVKDKIKFAFLFILVLIIVTVAILSALALVFFVVGLIVQQAQVLLYGHLVGPITIMATGALFTILGVLFAAFSYLIVSLLIDILRFFKNTKLKDLNPFEKCEN